MDRIYEKYILNCLQRYPQMAFLVGPRQVGKTTLARKLQTFFDESIYLNWDVVQDRQQLLSGQHFIEEIFPSTTLRTKKPLIIFDEIHKYKHWKNYLKGFYDLYKDAFHILVTGSARLDVYQAGGDSLMGRYFQYHLHPLSVRELASPNFVDPEKFPNPPLPLNEDHFNMLLEFGGFPDPFLQHSSTYTALWQSSRLNQLIYEDVQSLSQLHDLSLLEVLATLLRAQAGQLLNRSNLAKKIQVTGQTVARWIDALERFYYCFTIQPWHKNVTRSLIKEPKLYLWDWSLIEDEGQRFENFMASHLLKFVHFQRDFGLGNFDLFYLRDTDKKEVDFLITKDNKPFFMIEAKSSSNGLSSSLAHFQKQLHVEWALQSTKNMPFVNKSCFETHGLWNVPAKTLLAQLI